MTKALRDTATGVGKAAAQTVGKATQTAAPGTDTPTGALQQSVHNLAGTLAERAVAGLSDRVSKTAGRLTDYAENGDGNLLAAVTGVERLAGGASPLQAAVSGGMSKLGHSVRDKFQAVKDSFTGGGRKSGAKKLKVTNIVEHIDVGVALELAYDQWTRFADFPKFTKRLEQVEQVEDQKLRWTGKVFWSRRTWESTIVEQVPFERIIWRSKGAKGYIDGAVTFHEITPDLTRILVVLEYHPHGAFEKTANLWRAAGRRCRLELKHFQRHVMTEAVRHSEDIVGWHGEIHDNEVVVDDETARRAELADDDDEPASEKDTDEDIDATDEQETDATADDTDTDDTDTDTDDTGTKTDDTERRRPRRRASTARRNTSRRAGTKQEASR